MTEIYKGLDKLNDNFRQKVQLWLADVWSEIFITESRRSAERQSELYAQWRTKPWIIVTWTTHSNHEDWLAVDIAFHGDQTYPQDIEKWRDIADKAAQYGIDWWFDLWQKDKPHFQDNWKNVNLYIKKIIMAKYKEIFEEEVINAWKEALLKTHDWTDPLSEEDTKYLLDIVGNRILTKVETMIDEKLKPLSEGLSEVKQYEVEKNSEINTETNTETTSEQVNWDTNG